MTVNLSANMAFPIGSRIAVRCHPCPPIHWRFDSRLTKIGYFTEIFPFNREASEEDGDFKASYKKGMYTKLKRFDSPRKHAVRVELAVSHVFSHEKKFFCDNPSEKFAKLKVDDLYIGNPF